MSSMKSAPTENWDDDFLFQLTPARPTPARRSITQRESTSKSNSSSGHLSWAVSSEGKHRDDEQEQEQRQERGSSGGGIQRPSSKPPVLLTRRTFPESFSVGSGLDISDDQDLDLDLHQNRDGGRARERHRDEEDDQMEEEEDWDVELDIKSARLLGDEEEQEQERAASGLSVSSPGLLPLGSPLTSTPTSPLAGPGLGLISYNGRKNNSQIDLPTQAQDIKAGADSRKKGFRKSYHGQPSNALQPSNGVAQGTPPLPSLLPLPRTGSDRAPPSSFNRPGHTGHGGSGSDGTLGKEKGKQKGMGMMQRVVSLHKRFSSTSASAVVAQSRAVGSSALSDGKSQEHRDGDRKPSLKVDTSRTAHRRIDDPLTTSRAAPIMSTLESTRSIHTVLSSSAASSSSISSAFVDGLPGSRRPSGGLPTSPSMVSVGFHLPSPSPASPYYQQQHQSFQVDGHDEAGRIEEVLDVQRTPRGASLTSPREAEAGRELLKRDEEQRDVSVGRVSGRTAGTVGTAETLYMMNDMKREVAQMDADRFKEFKLGSPPALGRASSRGRLSAEKALPLALLPLPLDKKRKSTLKRLSSMSKRHGRKVSDGWRFVSGSSNSSASTFERKSSDGPPVVTPRTAPVSFAMQQQQQTTWDRQTASSPLPPLGSAFRLASPLEVGQTSASARSMRQTPSTTSSRISSDPQALRSAHDADNQEDRQRSPSSAGRRVSLSDLKIPSRVASAQKGVKEGIMAAKQFAGCVMNLKALVAQRAVLESRLTPAPLHDSTSKPAIIDEEFAKWWDMAHILIQLGETGTNESQPASPLPGDDLDLKRERRITLASDSTPSPTMARGNIPIRRSRTELRPLDAGLPHLDSLQRLDRNDTADSTGSMGRQEFSLQQVELLRDILQTPAGTSDTYRQADRSKYGAIADQRSQRDPIRLSRSSTKENRPLPLDIPLPPTPTESQIPTIQRQIDAGAKMTKRRSSRSGFFNLRDMWRTTSNSNVNAEADIPKTPISPNGSDFDQSMRTRTGLGIQASSTKSPKSPARPGLAGMFRRSSQSSGLLLDLVSVPTQRTVVSSSVPPPVTSRSGEKAPSKMQALRRKSSRVVSRLSPSPSLREEIGLTSPVDSSKRSSASSSASDWDRPTNKELEIRARAARTTPDPNLPVKQPSVPFGTLEDGDRTIGRSDSRRMLANLGVRPGAGSPRPVYGPAGAPAPHPTAPLDSRGTLVLTPDNLLPLLKQAKLTVEKCEQSLKQVGHRAD